MKFENIYLRSFVAFVLTIFFWFWAAPTCFNWSPLLGAICVALPPVLIYWIIIKPIIKKSKESTVEKSADQYKVKK